MSTLNYFLGVLMLEILFSCAIAPQQIIENTAEFQKYRNSIVRVESKLGFFFKVYWERIFRGTEQGCD